MWDVDVSICQGKYIAKRVDIHLGSGGNDLACALLESLEYLGPRISDAFLEIGIRRCDFALEVSEAGFKGFVSRGGHLKIERKIEKRRDFALFILHR